MHAALQLLHLFTQTRPITPWHCIFTCAMLQSEYTHNVAVRLHTQCCSQSTHAMVQSLYTHNRPAMHLFHDSANSLSCVCQVSLQNKVKKCLIDEPRQICWWRTIARAICCCYITQCMSLAYKLRKLHEVLKVCLGGKHRSPSTDLPC